MYRFIGRHAPEVLALLCSALAVLVGTYLAWSSNPAWLNRAGALVIIVGVLLAASRFQEWVQNKVVGFVEANFDAVAEEAILTVRSEYPALNAEDEQQIKAKLKPKIHAALADIFKDDARRLKAWEVWLVVVGTFLNGFGDFVISQAKTLVP